MRAFPILYTPDVVRLRAFYERLGFEQTYQNPEQGDPGYVSMRRELSEIGIVNADFPKQTIGVERGDGARFELFVYVDDVDVTVEQLRDHTAVLKEPELMPWGERLAYVGDPDGNPVALAQVLG